VVVLVVAHLLLEHRHMSLEGVAVVELVTRGTRPDMQVHMLRRIMGTAAETGQIMHLAVVVAELVALDKMEQALQVALAV
jgi:hypothetical protein